MLAETNTAQDIERLITRGCRAYRRRCTIEGREAQMLWRTHCDVREHGGRRYVVVANGDGLLGVFRITLPGLLKWLRRWPKAIEIG